jgi:hypothetical protein
VNDRGLVELELLRNWFDQLEYHPSGDWVVLREYRLPDGWRPSTVDLAFQIPTNLPAQAPYAFYVRPLVTYKGQQPSNCGGPVGGGPVGGEWAQFSWAPERWEPHSSPLAGDNMVSFARSIGSRFTEGA